MKNAKKSLFRVITFLLIATFFMPVFAVNNAYALPLADPNAVLNSMYVYGDNNNADTKIFPQYSYGAYSVIMPSSASPEAVKIHMDIPFFSKVTARGNIGESPVADGIVLNLNSLCSNNDYTVTFEISDKGNMLKYTIKFLFSENIAATYLLSEDPVGKGRAWVEGSIDKSNKAKGNLVLQAPDGRTVYTGALTQIKGRGNTTWGLVKKPYQIKLDSKADLLETGDDKNKSKTWILLANYLDSTSLRNTLALNLGNAMGMDTNIQSRYTDLYYDGVYCGTYMLTEKVEVGKGRVNITDMEELNEEANPGVDIEGFPTQTATTANGAFYKYCEGMKSPEDITGGYLLEMDYEVRALEEVCYLRTTRGQHVVVKSPEFASKEEMDYIATLYQEYEDAVYNGGTNPATGKKYSDYVDVRSVACYYLVNEFSQSRDCFLSSAYLRKEAGEDKMYMGPLWDYDMSFGKGGEDGVVDDKPKALPASISPMGTALIKLDDFYNTAKNIYINEMYPIIKNVILGDSNAVSENGALRSLSYYENEVIASSILNNQLWYPTNYVQGENAKLRDFITQRADNLKEIFEYIPSIANIKKRTFLDVLPSAWYYPEITNACEHHLMYGIGNNLFGPDYYMDRGQTAQLIANMAGKADAPYRNKYYDVSASDWYASSVMWISDEGIIEGFADNTFKPKEDITREQLMLYLYRYMKCPKTGTNNLAGYYDASHVSSEMKDAVEWGISVGIMAGYNNYINPKNKVSRAEIAAILMRLYNYASSLEK